MTPLSLESAIALRHAASASPGRSPAYNALVAIVDRIRTRYRRATDVELLTGAERRLLRLIVELDGEIANGGLDQYLRNSSGDHAQEALSDLEAIGASAVADVLRTAAAWFPDGVISPDSDTRFDQLIAIEDSDADGFEDRITALTKQYREGAPALYELLMDYVEHHRSELAAPVP
jgi:Domain of unknown function (DUF4375)